MADWFGRIIGTLTQLFQAFITWAFDWIKQLLDPIEWMEKALYLVGAVTTVVGSFLPADASEAANGVATFLQQVPIRDGISSALWFCKPFMTPAIVLSLWSGTLLVSIAALVLKFAIWIKNLFWASS